MNGYFNKVLHIDLSARSWQVERLDDKVLSRWLGGRGLGCYLLWKNLKPGADALSADNVLIFTVGPATSVGMTGSSRYGVYSKSPLTGFFADSYAGGRVAPQITKSGYDAVVIHGAVDVPVFLEISSDRVKFHDAADLWGMETYRTEDECLKCVGVKDAQVLEIGPAGENLVRFACIENNRWHSAGRTGMGAVMGSKKLKAVVFHGNAKVTAADPAHFKSIVQEMNARAKDNPGVQKYRDLGTPMLVAMTNAIGAFPSEYWSKGTLEGWEKISAETLVKDFQVKPRACPRCFFACSNAVTVTRGRHQGLEIEGPEYETIYSFGGLCKILDLGEICYLNDICDRYGIDTITAGNLVGFSMEMSRQGRIDEKIDYGNPDHAAELLGQICRREGLGKVLAEGIKRASQVLEAEDLAVHVKGMEPAGYDPRVLKGMSLGYASSPRGACHLPATFYIFELRGVFPPDGIDGKAGAYIGYENRLTILDTLIMCRFFRDMLEWDGIIDLIKAVTGLEYDVTGLNEIANNISTLRRMISLREGWSKQDDMLPPRLLEPLGEHRIDKDDFLRMLEEYYQGRGWDTEGIPRQNLDI